MDRRAAERELVLLREQKIRQQRNLYRDNYLEYVKYVHRGKWFPGKHLIYICSEIQKLLDHKTDRNILIISMPPQHGKSMCLTETLPSYYLGNHPSDRVIEVSYGDDLAQGFGRRNKEKIIEFGKELFNIELSRTSDTDFEIKNTKGTMISKGIMAGITGKSAELIIIDDPIKNKQEAESRTYRDRVWEEFLNSVYTRLSANGIIILIMTRWHEDDLAGRLLSTLPNKCKEINIPLEAEDNDILGRAKGDSLFPEIGKNNAWLKDFKTVYTSKEGSRSWNALMQGKPTAQEGNMIKRKWWQYYDTLPTMIQIVMSVDATFKDSDTSDCVAIQIWGKRAADMYLIDSVNEIMDFPTTVQTIIDLKAKYPNTSSIFIEDKANGSAIISVLRRKIPGIIPIQPDGGKVSRVNAISGAIEAGNVFLPNGKQFTFDFVDQCSKFPNGTHDDMVDAMSQAINRFMYFMAGLPGAKEHYNFPSEKPQVNPMLGGSADRSYIDYNGGY